MPVEDLRLPVEDVAEEYQQHGRHHEHERHRARVAAQLAEHAPAVATVTRGAHARSDQREERVLEVGGAGALAAARRAFRRRTRPRA